MITNEQREIAALRAEVHGLQEKVKRLEDEPLREVAKVQVVDHTPVTLKSFKQHYREIEDKIAASPYLSHSVKEGLDEVRHQVIYCPSGGAQLEHEVELMRFKALSTSPQSPFAQLAIDVASKSTLNSLQMTKQLAVFGALFEISRFATLDEKADLREFEYLKAYDGRQLLDQCKAGLSDVIALRKAKISGDLDKISAVISEILEIDE